MRSDASSATTTFVKAPVELPHPVVELSTQDDSTAKSMPSCSYELLRVHFRLGDLDGAARHSHVRSDSAKMYSKQLI
eukprot:COSAG02_NODE_39_length_48074_cov_106.508890_31_plen_77_part_00